MSTDVPAASSAPPPELFTTAPWGPRRRSFAAWLSSVGARCRAAAVRAALTLACALRRRLRAWGDALVPGELLVSEVATGALDAQVARCLCELGVASALVGHGPQTAEALARRLDLSPPLLARLLAFAATLGLVKRGRRHVFVANRSTRQLNVDQPNGSAAFVRYFTGPGAAAAVGALTQVVRTERDPYVLAHGRDVWSYFADHAEEAAHFDQAMVAMSSRDASDIAALLGERRTRHLCDIGGGRGTVTAAVLRRFAGAHASVIDRPEVLPECRAYLREQGVLRRATLVPGNFFAALPEAGSCYLLRNILHDWNDEDATAVLRQCRRAMAEDATLAVVETVLVDRGGFAGLAHRMDMVMMVGTVHGRQRDRRALTTLLGQAGFAVESRLKLPSSCDLWLCRPRAVAA